MVEAGGGDQGEYGTGDLVEFGLLLIDKRAFPRLGGVPEKATKGTCHLADMGINWKSVDLKHGRELADGYLGHLTGQSCV